MINSRKLEIIRGSEFNSLIKPEFDPEKCKELGIDELQDGAVAVHGLSAEKLKDAPTIDSVWPNFVDYVNGYNKKGTQWFAPIQAGYNINNFDNVITERMCRAYGPTNKKGNQGLFHSIYTCDMLQLMFLFFENDKDVNSLSADNLIRGHMGYAKGQAHDAMSDVIMTAELLCKSLSWIRTRAARTKFKGSMV